MALSLEITAHAVTAILAAWLGLLVISRARQTPGAPVFGLLCLLLVVWSVAIIGQRLGENGDVHPVLNIAEDLAAFLLPATTAHLGITVALEGRRSGWATAVLLPAYVIGLAAWVQTIADPAHPILPAPPHFEPFGIPGEVLGWAFIVVRAAVFGAGITWLVIAMSRAHGDLARLRQLQVTLITLTLGIAGGMARILPEGLGGPAWFGIALVAAAAVLAVYAVLAQRLFAGADSTARTFRISLVAGLGVVGYVAVVAWLDTSFRNVVGIEIPIILALALVGTVALYGPVVDLARRFLSTGGEREVTLDRLLHALGEDILSGRRAESLLEPALGRLVRTFDLGAAAILDQHGEPVVVHGDRALVSDLPMRVPVESVRGHLALGLKRSGLPLTPGDVELIRLVVSYIDAASRLDARQSAEADVLAELSREGGVVDQHEAAVSHAFARHGSPPSRGLRIYALGPFRGELDGEQVRQWGGAKAGARQAEAIFAFLFDRGVRGAGKDEIVELVWPDIDLDRADAAFHRTIFGLRAALSGGQALEHGGPITFSNDRYVLLPTAVAWSDVAAFDDLMTRARGAGDDERVRLLETARALYRGDAYDDCPFYGDSVHVEESRQEWRERYVDLLIDLGEAYARRGDRSGAADALRRAASLTERDVPLIDDILRGLNGTRLEGAGATALGSSGTSG